jgi:hypothetical protein
LEKKCQSNNPDLQNPNPTLEMLVDEFKGEKQTDKQLFMHAHHFCKNMMNSSSYLMLPTLQPLYVKLNNMRKNCFLLMCDSITKSETGQQGGHIKKKLIRKKIYRNLNKITNKTSRKKTKLTEIFKTKVSNNKTLRNK